MVFHWPRDTYDERALLKQAPPEGPHPWLEEAGPFGDIGGFGGRATTSRLMLSATASNPT